MRGRGRERRWTLSGHPSPRAVPRDLISFDARPLIPIASPMDWARAVGRRFVPLLLALATLFRFWVLFLISFVNCAQRTLVGVSKRVSMTYIDTSEADLCVVGLTTFKTLTAGTRFALISL